MYKKNVENSRDDNGGCCSGMMLIEYDAKKSIPIYICTHSVAVVGKTRPFMLYRVRYRNKMKKRT